MSDACNWSWYPSYGGAKRNIGIEVRKHSIRRLGVVSCSAVYLGCFPICSGGWPEAISKNIAAVLLLLRRCVRGLLRPQYHLGCSAVRHRKRRGFCTSGTTHIHGGHRSVRLVGCTNACRHFAKINRSHSDGGRRVSGGTSCVTSERRITLHGRPTSLTGRSLSSNVGRHHTV